LGVLPYYGAIDLNGQRFFNSLSWAAAGPSDLVGEWSLGRSYRRFRAVVGLSDQSDAGGQVKFEVIGDGRSLYEATLPLGEAATLDLAVPGVLRLTLRTSRLDSSEGAVDGVWADAEVIH
jgi:hypothetical protein